MVKDLADGEEERGGGCDGTTGGARGEEERKSRGEESRGELGNGDGSRLARLRLSESTETVTGELAETADELWWAGPRSPGWGEVRGCIDGGNRVRRQSWMAAGPAERTASPAGGGRASARGRCNMIKSDVLMSSD
ncbi:hypothetical protein [Streptacidiphilus jiangxiensis]|uniref:hypothetical protein n=1 Tax=Streptacidiphilus jiangxiensis TaxID=235985 RepID=UPI0005A6CE68|nr:hypothetical protein [Streptacidiphilus jiangxiensis]